MYTLQKITEICGGRLISTSPEAIIENFTTDSRNSPTDNELFIALNGKRFDGHNFITKQVEKGTAAFLISDASFITDTESLSWILVEDSLLAFQKIAAYHRKQFSIPVIGITGSYGKTIVKEWLFQLLSPDFYVVKSPKSYNSQVGVPLSVMQMNNRHELAIFEAGISRPNEMNRLAQVIQPTIGLFTTIGNAHAEGFASQEEKLKEKIKLFQASDIIICERRPDVVEVIRETYPSKIVVAWELLGNVYQCDELQIALPDNAMPFFKENICHCIAVLQHFGVAKEEIEQRIALLENLPMRLEVLNGKWNSTIVNDSYSNDLAGLSIALEHAQKIAPNKSIGLVLSEFVESGFAEEELKEKLASLIFSQNIGFLVLIGEFYSKNKDFFEKITQNASFFDTTEDAISHFDWKNIAETMVVVKGARKDRLEEIVEQIKEKTHQTIWEINLSQLIENLNYYKSLLDEQVKLLVMVKATAYGTEANKIAHTLQNQRVDYLGVAYPEEGVALREEGITLPILVMNTAVNQFEKAVNYSLEVQLYSLSQAEELFKYCEQNHILDYPVHLKLDTGMNRLGFSENDLPKLFSLLEQYGKYITIRGILSHLAVADEPEEIAFSKKQVNRFEQMVQQILPYCEEKPLLHLLNSAGIESGVLPQFDMVRLGIGLHGISSNRESQKHIQQVGSLVATISQVREVKKGETVGYGRSFVAEEDCRIAIISIGYADGYDRRLSNGVGEVILHGKRARIVGNICMDMCMIDVTHIPKAKAGDEVILTNTELPIIELAHRMNTIPYEVLTSISTRVQRRFIYE